MDDIKPPQARHRNAFSFKGSRSQSPTLGTNTLLLPPTLSNFCRLACTMVVRRGLLLLKRSGIPVGQVFADELLDTGESYRFVFKQHILRQVLVELRVIVIRAAENDDATM